jgi:Glycosyltransferase family 87
VWLVGATVLAVVLCAVFFSHPHHQPKFDDTAVYWGAGSKALHHQTVYDVTGYYTFNYLPFASLFYAFAFAVFPIGPFGWAFYFLSVAAWLGVVVTLGRAVLREALGTTALPRAFDWMAVVAFALFYGMGLRDELKLGQTMIIPLCAATAFIVLYQRGLREPGRTRTLGQAIALAGLACFAFEIKIYFAILVALLAFRREWRIVGLIAAWHIFFNVVCLALYHGPSFALSENLRWFSAVRYASRYHMESNHNMSVMGLVSHFAPHAVARVAWLAAVGAFLAGLWRIRRAPPIRGFAACLAAVVALNPIAWPYWMLLGFPALLLVIGELLKRVRTGQRELALAVAPTLLVYFVMSALQNEDIAQHGGLLLATGILVYLVMFFSGAFGREAALS